MTLRSFSIQASGVVGLALLSGCTPAIVGDWNLTAFAVDGDNIDLEYTYDGYTITTSMTMEVEDDLAGSVHFEQVIEGYGTYSEMEGDVEAEMVDLRTFDVTLDIDGDELNLECTVDSDEMECEGKNDGTEYEMEWERD